MSDPATCECKRILNFVRFRREANGRSMVVTPICRDCNRKFKPIVGKLVPLGADDPGPAPRAPAKRRGLGDAVELALSAVGITQERVQKYVGNCGCGARKEKLNRLGEWASGVLGGAIDGAREKLETIINCT